jgi:hypothetical protein
MRQRIPLYLCLVFVMLSGLAATGFSQTSPSLIFQETGLNYTPPGGLETAYSNGTANPIIEATAYGDFNRDGKIDLAVVSYITNTLTIFLGNGDGTFQAGVDYPVGASPMSIAVADFNGDGNPDIAVANFTGGTISVLLGNGDGTFKAAVNYTVGGYPLSITAGAFKGDGKIDLAVANPENGAGGEINVLLNNGDGTFTIEAPITGFPYPNAIAAADINGDGKLDLVVANDYVAGNNFAGNVEVLLGNGNGTFQTPAIYPLQGNAFVVALGDFNSDGHIDVAVGINIDTPPSSPYGETTNLSEVGVLINNGSGTFHTPFAYYSMGLGNQYDAPNDIVVGDLFGNGKLDLLVDSGYENTVLLPGNGDGTFQTAINTGLATTTLALADFNGDGKLDLAASYFYSEHVLIGKGDGTFQTAPTYAAGLYPGIPVVADFDGDGKLDVVVAPVISENTVTLLRGNGDGTFQAPVTTTESIGTCNAIAGGDFNGDGKPDVAIVNCTGGTGTHNVSVLLGNGDGTFKPIVNSPLLSPATNPVVGDFNGDGKLDLAVIHSSENKIGILLGNGDGTFNAEVEYSLSVAHATQIAVGDLNRDGNLDLVVSTEGTSPSYSNTISIFLGNGDGTFQPETTYAVSDAGTEPICIAVKDLNGDGNPDLIVGTILDAAVRVLLGNGDGTFQSPQVYPGVSLPQQILTSDFNGDGKLDLAVMAGAEAKLLLGNGDGTFQATDMSYIAPGPGAVADLNGDGRPDFVLTTLVKIGVLLNTTHNALLTSVSLSSGLNPSTFGEDVTFTAKVTANGGTPTGTVTFNDGTAALGTETLSGGTASISGSLLAVGSHSITAVYSGAGTFAGSSSAALTQIVNSTAPTVSFTGAPVTAAYMSTFSVTATTNASTTPSITGTAGVCTVSGNTVSMVSSTGTCTLTASWAADSNYSSATASQTTTATHASTTTTVVSISPEPSAAGSSYSVSVSVSPQFGGTPSGTVNVSDDTGAACPIPITLSSGAGSCSLTSTVAGGRTITATYGGDTNFNGSKGTSLHSVGAGPLVTLVLSPLNATIVAGQSQMYSATGFDVYNNPYGDVTSSTTFSLLPNGSCIGTSCTATVADQNGSVRSVTGTYPNGVQGQTSLTVSPGSVSQLQLLVPGETAAPGTTTGKTGTPSTEYVNGPVQVTVNVVDQFWNPVNTSNGNPINDTIHFVSTDGRAVLPSPDPTLTNGTGSFRVTLDTVSNPASSTITATDSSNSTTTQSMSSPIEVIVAYTAGINPTDWATGQVGAYTLTVSNAAAPNANNLSSVEVAVPAADQGTITPTSVLVTAMEQGGTTVNWSYDPSLMPGIMRFFENTTNDAVAPGGTITITFTAMSNATVTNSSVQEVWTTTAYSDAASANPLPLAWTDPTKPGSEPTVNLGAAPAITSANTATITYSTLGTFTVTTTGVPTPSLTESGALPGGVTFADNHDGTATLTGMPSAAGSYPFTITAHNGYGSDATQSFTLSVKQTTSTTTFTSTAPSQLPFNGTYTPSASTTGDGSLTIGANGACSMTAGVVTITAGSGTCTITAVTAAGNNYLGSSATPQAITAIPAGQAITVTKAAPASANYGATFAVAATASSGLPVAITTAGACSGSGSGSATVSMISGTGSCQVSFNQTGNTNYNAAPMMSSSTLAAKISSTVKITSNTPNPSSPSQSVAVNFQASGSGMPTGTVTVAASTGESCSAKLSSGAGNCLITFVTVGSRTLTATYFGDTNFITSTSASVTQSVIGPLASVSPSSVSFGTVYLGTITTKAVTITNLGNAPMTIKGPLISIVQGGNSEEFVAVNLCPGSLAVGKSCTISVSFFAGPYYNPQTAVLSIVDNAPGSPQTVSLTATVINPQAQLSTKSLTFSSKVGTTSAVQSVKLTNTGTTTLVLSTVTITGNFALVSGTTCGKGTTLAASSSCVINVTFTPVVKGTLTGSVTITDNALVNQQVLSLNGKGM